MAGEYVIELLEDHHADALKAFSCGGDYADELVEFLQNEALSEHRNALSTTFLAFSESDREIDAFVTLSATSIKMNEALRTRFGAGRARPQIPAVMMDYIAVSDAGRRRHGKGLGLDLFQWVKAKVHSVNGLLGMRIIGLDVRAGNWRAYQRYSSPEWGFRALYLPENKAKNWPGMHPPDPLRPTRPDEVHPDRYIKMYYDLVEHYGPYRPPDK